MSNAEIKIALVRAINRINEALEEEYDTEEIIDMLKEVKVDLNHVCDEMETDGTDEETFNDMVDILCIVEDLGEEIEDDEIDEEDLQEDLEDIVNDISDFLEELE